VRENQLVEKVEMGILRGMASRPDLQFELSFFESLHRRMPRDIRVASVLANIYTQVGQLDAGLRMDRKLVRLDPKDPTAHYNLACSLSLKGRLADAVKTLRTAISLGYDDFHWMQHDPDLHDLADYPGFSRLMADLGIGK
jgi:tetratricopeptide (TPR) repeat protein